MISVIIPALNEAAGIRAALSALQPLRAEGHEVIVAEGGSADGTAALVRDLADVVLDAPRGRARQMNAGAAIARGDILLFLHADTVLPEGAAHLVAAGLAATGRAWGRFDLHIAGKSRWFPLIAFMINLRSRLTGIATGDQAIFVSRKKLENSIIYDDIPLMEDIALSKRLARLSPPLCLRERATTSGRRWEEHGIWRTIVLMWGLRLRYFLGASPEQLAKSYARGAGH